MLNRFRLSLTSELRDLILDSSDICGEQKGYTKHMAKYWHTKWKKNFAT